MLAREPELDNSSDLSTAHDLPQEFFDCIIVTQVLQFVYDLHRALKICIAPSSRLA